MRKLIFILIIMITFTSCESDPKRVLIGEWKEYHGIGQETDITYNNIYKIEFSKNDGLNIKCINSDNYIFDNIVYDGNELSFRQENISVPNEKFYIYKKLVLKKNKKWLEGTFLNSKNQKRNIKWEKIK